MGELEAAVRSADDKERLIGLIAAPLAAGIGMLVISALVTNDPAARLKDGRLNSLHVNPAIYHDLLIVLLVLSVAMLAAAWSRKRLYLGVVTALYGLAIFNLHYWGFGVPFIMVAAWLLVRSYRLQRDLRAAAGEPAGGRSHRAGTPARGRGPQSRRYTPPPTRPKRPATPSAKERRAG